jgi:oligopeptidase A
MENNPLIGIRFPIQFDQVRAEHIEPAVAALIARSNERLEQIAAHPGPRTWGNTMSALDTLTEELDYAMGVARHLESVATTPELRAAYNAAEPAASAFYSRIPLHEGLWRALQEYAATPEAQALTGPRKRFLDKTIAAFRRHGASLPPEGKAELERIDVELARLTTKFSENVLDSTNAWELVITDESQLAGLPPIAVEMARDSAASKQVEGWRFTLQQPSYLAVMTYLDDASVREEVYLAYQTRATQEPHDNRGNLKRILELRKVKANLLGFGDFSDFVLEDRMAGDGQRAKDFLEDLKVRTRPYFERENYELEAFRRELEGADAPSLEPWDIGYYAEKLRRARYDLDEEMLRSYFPLEHVVAGLFETVQRLYGITVKERPGAPVWDPMVRFYEIQESDGSLLGSFYADWYPRENKRGGAWMDAFITGHPSADGFTPHLGLICGNMTPPTGGKPALLTHREVETVFHEFGHLLHHCLSRVEIRSMAGTSVAWDFVELPSQVMENWCWEPEALDLLARHWQSGESLPEELFQRLVRTRTFRAANAMMRQLSFGFIDLALHRVYQAERDGDVVDYSRNILQSYSPAPLPTEHAMITAFTHLFASPVGYAAGYYSYKWAEVLDADAFTLFRQLGVFSREAGMRFRHQILARGDSDDPAELFRGFLGRDPDPIALLERAGLRS